MIHIQASKQAWNSQKKSFMQKLVNDTSKEYKVRINILKLWLVYAKPLNPSNNLHIFW